jgi:cell filamentation protein
VPSDPPGIDPHFDYRHGILTNTPGYTTQTSLDRFEAAEAAEALIRLQVSPVMGAFDVAHLKEIHARIFKRIYPWAGEFRHVNIRRSESYYFAMVQFMEQNLVGTFAKLASEDHLKGMAVDCFASRSAYYLGELNAIHPFREGNGRTQREFIRQLASEAGHRINWYRISHEQMYEASVESHSRGANTAFSRLIALAMEA